MKSSIVRTFATLILGAILSPLALLAQEQLNVTIPFAFTVGARSFAAGDYSVHQLNNGHVLQIRSQKDGVNIMTTVMRGEESKTAGKSVLTFKQYGDRYFLAAVATDREGWRLFQSKAEKELIAKARTSEAVVIAAASK